MKTYRKKENGNWESTGGGEGGRRRNGTSALADMQKLERERNMKHEDGCLRMSE